MPVFATSVIFWSICRVGNFRHLPLEFTGWKILVPTLAFCVCKNKDADHLRSNPEADQRLCFRYIDSTIPLLPKSVISSLQPSCVAIQPGLCWTWSETPKTYFLVTVNFKVLFVCLICCFISMVNSYKGDVRTASYPNHTVPGQASRRQYTSI